ncbi:uncharacterized protein LOC125036083 isoform X2 [Penaeus chinensis]|uniref:uncharacterized protein LOC125036083 isoform X2 n=1 Tax=Penaeus chinensis TaxID=139456 RepID=UPI001FB76A19|nr:uncharacterized protein LOC125036083 isoform X2 [Penaeus chinensis]
MKMLWRSLLVLSSVLVSVTAEAYSVPSACLVRTSITTVLRRGSILDFEAFVSSQSVTLIVTQLGKTIKTLLTNETALVMTPGYSKAYPVSLCGWKRFRIEVDGSLLLAERGGGILLGEQADRQLGLDSVSEIRVAVSGSALMGNCKTGSPTWIIYSHELTTVKIFNEDFSSKNFTLSSRDFFLVYLELCSKVLLVAGLRRSGFSLQFDRVKMTVTPVLLQPPFRPLHRPIFCPERYVDLQFSSKAAESSIFLTLNPPNSEVKGESVSTGPIGMPSNITGESGFSSGGDLVTSSDIKHVVDHASGSGNGTVTSSDTGHAGALDSESGNGTATSSDTELAGNLSSSPSARPMTSENTTFDPRRPTFPVVTILNGEPVTTPRAFPDGGDHRNDLTLSELVTLIAMVITLIACMTAVFCIRYYLGYFRIRCRRRDTGKTTSNRQASPAPSTTGSYDSDGYITLDDLPKRPLPRPPCPFPRTRQINAAVSSSSSSRTSFSVVSSSSSSSFPRSSSERAANQAASFSETPTPRHSHALRLDPSQDSATSRGIFSAKDSTAYETDSLYEEIHIYVDIEGERLYSNVPAGGASAEATG